MAWVLDVRASPTLGYGLGRIAGAAAMKRAMIIAGLLAVAGCASSPRPAAAGPHGNCSHPFPGNTAVLACMYADGLYSVSYRDENQYYWQPAKGDFAVAETFYKKNAPGRAAGAWSGRTISVGDSCVISDNWIPNVTHPPSDCMDSRDEEMRGATSEEQRSVLAFWRVMAKDVPSADR
jgi:hypothetical protein